MEKSFFLSRESLIPSDRPDLQPWREQIFMEDGKHRARRHALFRLPPDRAVEIGSQVES
jgi:KUP system potassium uptake protein